ncbi:unnamed protein product, partial [Amoebophrya sp. A120]|eukprot:GSA120T00011435001.1
MSFRLSPLFALVPPLGLASNPGLHDPCLPGFYHATLSATQVEYASLENEEGLVSRFLPPPELRHTNQRFSASNTVFEIAFENSAGRLPLHGQPEDDDEVETLDHGQFLVNDF